MAPVDVTDFDSDDEGEVPPLLGPGATTVTVPSMPSTAPKKPPAANTAKAAAAPASAPAAPPPPKPGANLKPSTGLRKGFLGGGGSSRPNKGASASSSSSSGSSGASVRGELPTLRSDADAKAKRLQLPEVQETLAAEQAEAKKLGGDNKNAWMTPELLAKIAANPLLRKGFTDPRCQQAMAEMQTDPQAAMKKYGDQPEMRTFLQAFMKLMGEHFSALADKEEKEKKEQEAARQMMEQASLTPEEKKAKEVAANAMANPEVVEILKDPKIQSLLANMQNGVSFELEKAMRTDPDVVRKLKKLSQAGLIGMEWKE